jgi:riboflavin kinase/FMN adenylyltransferase
MQVFRGFRHKALARPTALVIGNFDGVHRGHQAMIALARNEAAHRGLPTTALTFEPMPREFFAPQQAPGRIANLRDKLAELQACGVEQTVVLRFDAALAAMAPQAFIDAVLRGGLQVRYLLVGDDFRFGARRAGDYALLDAAGRDGGFDVARMQSFEVHGLRVSSSAVRRALAEGDFELAASLLGRPYTLSGHVVHGRKLGRTLGFPTLNLRVPPRPALALKADGRLEGGIYVVRVQGLRAGAALDAVASLGVRPTVEDAGRMLLEVHVLEPAPELADAYGTLVRVEFLQQLRAEARYDSLAALERAIDADVAQARAFFDRWHASTRRQTTRDRI